MNLPPRLRRLLAIGAAIACFAIVSALTVHKILREEKQAVETYRTGIWAAVQLQVEYLKFAKTLEDYVRGGGTVSHDALMERYDILWSRFPVILDGRQSEAMRQTLPGMTDGIGTAFHRLQVLEAAIIALRPGKGAILFVDDEPSVARMGSRTLERAGYTVESMIDSEEALRAFRESPDRWDLVITDLTMPGLTGLAMAKTMLDIRPTLPIVLCTGFTETINETEAKASGITEFLMKPVVGAELTNLVDRALHHRPQPAGA